MDKAQHRSQLWQGLKDRGWVPESPFVKYSRDRLLEEWVTYTGESPPDWHPEYPAPSDAEPVGVDLADLPGPEPEQEPAAVNDDTIPFSDEPDPNELPGMRNGLEPIRQDSQGRIWLQEEFRKPAAAKPRARRVLRYQETGTRTETVRTQDGYTESFEVAGEGPGRPAEIKITLPTYQVGVYRDPRFPFKVVCYGGQEGFDREDVEEFYGGPELVPAEAKRMYVANTLCYDIRSVVRAIESEYRQMQLTGRITQ